MRHLFIFIFLFTVVSCTKDERNPEIETSLDSDLVGTWQLTATLLSDGGSSSNWDDVAQADSHTILLMADNTYVTEYFIEGCRSGDFDLEESILNFLPSGNDCSTLKFGYEIPDSTTLILVDQNNNCDEICAFRYTKNEER